MKLTWKLLPVVAAAAVGLLVMMPGAGPKSVSANVSDVSVSDATVTSGSTVEVTIDAEADDGPISVSLSGVSSGTSYSFTVTDCGTSCDRDGDSGTAFNDIPSTGLSGNAIVTLDLEITCTANDTVTINASQDGVSDSTSLACSPATTPSVTPTVTGTPPTATPTVTTTPTGDTITLSAVQPNPACGQAVFLFATVKNNQGGFVAGANVTFTSSGGGSFSPVSAVTVTDGVASSTFTPPTSGNTTVTITASTGGKTATANVPVNCGNPATSTPVPAAPTATPTGGSVVRPPSTGDAGLADDSSNFGLYAGLATVIGTVFLGALVVARRRA